MHSLTLVMGVVLPPQVRMPRMPTVCVVPFLLELQASLDDEFTSPFACSSSLLLSELLLLSWLPDTVRVVGFGV